MISDDSSFEGTSTISDACTESAAAAAGMAAIFRAATDFGPELLTLQQGLLNGLVRAQERETRRLASRYGEEDERTLQAKARTTAYTEVAAGAFDLIDLGARLSQTLTQDSLFLGRVVNADGTPVCGYTVGLELRESDQAGREAVRALAADTDAKGYFRIDLREAPGTKGSDGAAAATGHWSEWLARALDLGTAAGSGDAKAQTGGTATAPRIAGTRVQISDPGGLVVYDDPTPPLFLGLQSEFRHYVLSAASWRSGQETS